MKSRQYILTIFGVWLPALILISIFSFYQLPHHFNADSIFVKNLSNWDGGHFLGIAENGYKESYQYAFFPLYPLAIKYLTVVTHDFLVSAIIINLVSTIISLLLIYKLVSLDFSKKLSEKTVILFLIFPTAFFLLTTYSEALFLVLVLASFYNFRKNRLFLAALFASLSAATRLAGLALVITLIFEIYVTFGINRKNWYLYILAPLGFLAYCFYLYTKTHDPFYFTVAEQHWQRVLVPPGLSFWESLKNISNGGLFKQNLSPFLDLLFGIFGVGMIFRGFRFLPRSYSLYSFFSILIPLITPSLSSVPRFILPIFPIFITMAIIKNEYVIFGYQLIATMLLAIFVALFINGYWVS